MRLGCVLLLLVGAIGSSQLTSVAQNRSTLGACDFQITHNMSHPEFCEGIFGWLMVRSQI